MKDRIKILKSRYKKARDRRSLWESKWQECYEYSLPQRDMNFSVNTRKDNVDRLFDGTAPDAVEQLAASLLAQLTPPWASWFGLAPGNELNSDEKTEIATILDKSSNALKYNFNRSNFSVEMHQCYLDLVSVGTACLLFEEAPLGEVSAFRFTAVPLAELYVDEGPSGKVDTVFRRVEMSLENVKARFPEAELPEVMKKKIAESPDDKVVVVEAVLPRIVSTGHSGYEYTAFIDGDGDYSMMSGSLDSDGAIILRSGVFDASPFITFRWLKAPGEIYGRSPVMKTLPDIKTANKVVELVLKNATIAVTGIWQADDDGVLNPANIKLTPGTIIPKAVGSKGLTPLEAPGRFDISELVLDDLRTRIKHGMLVDKLGQISGPTMTATEILERSAEMARVLGATYGRLQSELLTPLVERAISILRRRGEIAAIKIDGSIVDLQYNSPLAREQSNQDAQNTISWLQSVQTMGPEAVKAVNVLSAARWLGRALGVPAELINEVEEETSALAQEAAPETAANTNVAELLNAAMGNGVVDAINNPAAQPMANLGNIIQQIQNVVGNPAKVDAEANAGETQAAEIPNVNANIGTSLLKKGT
ncbi:MAG: phage tail protein [Alphaproteobacteria bacterium]|nr:phage tail protein [Alphaproteobacteria bacterium]